MRRSRSVRTSTPVQRLAPVIQFLALGKRRFLVVAIVDKPILPFAGFGIGADRRV